MNLTDHEWRILAAMVAVTLLVLLGLIITTGR